MATPPRRCQRQPDEDDKPVMKVTVVSCKGERPSESVINVHIDGINPNANSPQIDKFMRRLTKNVVKIQNEIESQNNPNRMQIDSTSDSPADSDLQEMKTRDRKGKTHPTAMNARARERSLSPVCRHQNKVSPLKEALHTTLKLLNATSPQVKSNAPAKCTTYNTDIVEIYSNKLTKQSCDSVMNEWVSTDRSGGLPGPTQQPIRRKRSMSCNNIAAQRGQAVQVYHVNHPGTSRGKDNNTVGQEDTETDDISISTVSFGNKSTCSCCHHHLGELDAVREDGMPFGDVSHSTVVMSGKSSNSSAFCCGAPNQKRTKATTKTTTTTTSTSPDKKGAAKPGANKKSSDGASTVTDTSQDSSVEGGKAAKAGSEKKKDGLTEKEILEKQMALLNEKAKNEELSKKTEEQVQRINELNRKLDELFRINKELNRANEEEQRRKEEERWRTEDERQKELERRQAEEAKRLEKNYPGDGSNRRVRTITKGNRTNIEAIEELLHNKLPKQAVRNGGQGASRWGENPPNANRDSGPQRSQRLNSPAARGVRANEDRLPPPREDFPCPRERAQGRPGGCSAYDPSLDFSDRSRGPGNLETQRRRQDYDPSLDFSDRSRRSGNLEAQGRRQDYDPSLNFSDRSRRSENVETQGRRQDYDPSLDFSDRSRGPGNLEIQRRRQDYDPNLNFSDRSRGPGNFEAQGRRQEFYPNHDIPRDVPQGYPENARGPPQSAIPARVCERCGGSDQDVTVCCCFKKRTKSKAGSKPTSPQRLCKCCGQCPPRCICEKGDLAPVALYQNVATVPDIPAQIGDAVYPLRDFKSTEKTTLEDEPEKSPEIIASTPKIDVKQLGDGQPSASTERLDKSKSLGTPANEISRTGLDMPMSKASGVGEIAAPQMRSCECDGQQGGQASPETQRQPKVDPQFDQEKKEMFVQKMLSCDCAHTAHTDDGIHQPREMMSKESIPAAGGVVDINAIGVGGAKKSGPAKPKKRGNVFKFLCPCCNCSDSQQSLASADGVLQCISGECLDKTKSLGSLGNGISRARLPISKSKASSVGKKSTQGMRSCECNGQGEGQTAPEGVQHNVDPHFDNDKKEMFVQQKLGCDCEGQNDIQTVYEKFADETKKEELIKKMMTCACKDTKIKDFPSEELISFENYEEQYFDDSNGIDLGHLRGNSVDQKEGSAMQHSCACDGANLPKDLDRKRNLVERRLDSHGFGQRRDCDKKRALVQTRMGCACNAEETGETLKKQRILEDRLGCSCRPVGDPRKMSEYVRKTMGCGEQCDEHMIRETLRKQAIVERRLNCSANRLRDTDKKSAYLKRRLDCICDDAGTQARKQQAYLERFLTCGCTNVARDMQKKKQFVDDFLKCKCDKEAEVKKMQLYLERSLSCDCEHVKERNMDKKIDYMNKVMSCDGPSCKAEKEGKELATVCGDGKSNVEEVTKRLPPNPLAFGSSAAGNDALLCSCGSGDSFLGPCRCDSMTDVERSSVRRHRRGATSSVAGGLICRCGKEGEECICDGVTERPTKPSTQRSKAKCMCRHRLDGICRCRGKGGRNTTSGDHRSYLVDQVPCQSVTRATAQSVADPIVCSAKRGNCNCEMDPESCFCSEGSAAKSIAEREEEGSTKEEERRMSDAVDENTVEKEEDGTESAPKENQDDVDQIEEPPNDVPAEDVPTEDVPTEGTADEGWCVCKKNCSGKCKCDIDGSDCSQGKQMRRCYCDVEGPETCICVNTAGPQLKKSAQGKCRCTKDGAGRCKCDMADSGKQRSRSRSGESGTCHCRKDASGQCKCDKVDDKRSSPQRAGHSGVVIELKNVKSHPEVSISGLDSRKVNFQDYSRTSDSDGKEPDGQHHSTGHDQQVYYVESHQNDLFVLKEPDFEEFSSESCPESVDELANESAFESPLNTSTSGYEFESLLNTSASDQELKVSPKKSSSFDVIQSPTSSSARLGNDFEGHPDKSASESQDPPKDSTTPAVSERESFEMPQDSQNSQNPQESVASFVESHGTQARPSLTEMTGQVGPIEVQPVQVKPPATEATAASVRSAPAGPSMVLGEGRRPKWYHMFSISKGKSHKRRKRESEDSSGQSADADDC